MSAHTAWDGGPQVGRSRRTTVLRALAGLFYYGVAFQLIGGFLLPQDQGPFTTFSIPGIVSVAGMVTGVCAVILLVSVRPWPTRTERELDAGALEARRTATLRAFGLVAVAAIALLCAATLAAGFGDFTAGSGNLAPWLLGLTMLTAAGPSAALAWVIDQG